MKMYKEMKKINLAAAVVLLVLSGGLALAIPHLVPTPASLGLDWHLEAEGATSMGPAWNPITWGGISIVYRAPATQDGTGWFQWEGLSLVAGNYNMYASWTRPGSGWTYPNTVWAGPDAGNLREVVPYWDAVGFISYELEWDTVAMSVPLLATDTVIKITAQGLTGELEVDDFMLTTIPEPMTVALLGIGASSLRIRRRK